MQQEASERMQQRKRLGMCSCSMTPVPHFKGKCSRHTQRQPPLHELCKAQRQAPAGPRSELQGPTGQVNGEQVERNAGGRGERRADGRDLGVALAEVRQDGAVCARALTHLDCLARHAVPLGQRHLPRPCHAGIRGSVVRETPNSEVGSPASGTLSTLRATHYDNADHPDHSKPLHFCTHGSPERQTCYAKCAIHHWPMRCADAPHASPPPAWGPQRWPRG